MKLIHKRLLGVLFASSILSSAMYGKVLVTVDGYSVTDTLINGLKEQDPNFNYDALTPQQKNAFLDQLVQQVLVANAAKKAGLDKTEEYKMLEMSVLGRMWLQNELKSIDKDIGVSDKEAMDFYNANKSRFVEQKATLSHILVAQESQAKSIIDELNKATKSKLAPKFEELAKKMSEDKGSAVNGGKLENVNLNELVPEFKEAVLNLKPGSYTKTPVKTLYGYHVILLDELGKEVTLSLNDVKDQIKQGLKQQKQQKLIQDKLRIMRDNAKITYGS